LSSLIRAGFTSSPTLQQPNYHGRENRQHNYADNLRKHAVGVHIGVVRAVWTVALRQERAATSHRARRQNKTGPGETTL
jgi:hypothetical protein